MVAREASTTTELGGYRIPKGSYVFMSQYAMHRHPAQWTNPEAFDPSRFGPDASEPDRFVYFPFIRGRRQCIGDRFAEMELSLIIATLIQQYRFSLVPGQNIELEPSVTLRPKHGLRMTLTAR
jgi:cytochrome P450